MSRTKREAELKALYGPKYGAVVITEMGGPKRDRKKLLEKELLGSYQEGSLASLIQGALTAPDAGPQTPDLRKFGPAAASNFPLTAGSLLAAKMRGLKTEETPEGAYRIERNEPVLGDFGQTLGDAMFVNPGLTPEQDDYVYEHELGHVSQGRDSGLLFPLMNAADQIRTLLQGTDPQDSHFEGSANIRGKEILR